MYTKTDTRQVRILSKRAVVALGVKNSGYFCVNSQHMQHVLSNKSSAYRDHMNALPQTSWFDPLMFDFGLKKF